MVIKCDIVFDNNYNKTYYSGDTVKGSVVIECNNPKKISDIIFRAKGETTVKWGESDMDNTVTYTGKDQHFRTINSMLTDAYPKHDGYAMFAEGIHEFQFSFELPDVLPTSYDLCNGKVSYSIKITIERPMKLNIINRYYFTVITRCDTTSAVFKTPICHKVSENFHTLFMQKGTLMLDIKIPASGYCVGQEIPIELLVKNNSKVALNTIYLWLEQKMTFTSTSPSKRERVVKNKITNYKGDGIDKEKSKMYNVILKVPSEIAPTYTASAIYAVEYFIKVEVLVSGLHSNLKTKIPLTIGCLPPFIPPLTRRVSHAGDPSKVTFDLCRRPSSSFKDSEILEIPPFLTESYNQKTEPSDNTEND